MECNRNRTNEMDRQRVSVCFVSQRVFFLIFPKYIDTRVIVRPQRSSRLQQGMTVARRFSVCKYNDISGIRVTRTISGGTKTKLHDDESHFEQAGRRGPELVYPGAGAVWRWSCGGVYCARVHFCRWKNSMMDDRFGPRRASGDDDPFRYTSF